MPKDSLRRGNILLGLSLIVFICSLIAAAVIWWLLRGQPGVAGLRTPFSLPADNQPTADLPVDVLSPTVTIDPLLQSERNQIQSNLVEPLRHHWATKPERLATIDVAAITDEEESYRARVSLHLIDSDGKEQRLSFLYDLSPWTPSMLDNE